MTGVQTCALPISMFKSEGGCDGVNTSRLWMFAKIPRVKKMRLSNHAANNAMHLEVIRQGLAEKTDISIHSRSQYDTTFEYKPEANKAWYSEEFRGCGNGHYYLALDSTNALFYEDD